MSDIFLLNPKNDINDNVDGGFIPMAYVCDGYSGEHTFITKQWGDIKKGFSHFQNGDIGIAKISPCFENRKSVIFSDLPNNIGSGTTELVVLRGILVNTAFYLLLIKSDWYISEGTKYFKGVVGQQRVHKDIFTTLQVPMPPLREQQKIVDSVKKWFSVIDEIENGATELKTVIKQTKSKILDLAISGKLVSQDPIDEPAIELLNRINPDFKPCDNSHYENLPQGWVKLRLGDVCSFERGITFPSSAKCTIKQPGMIACIRTANVQDNLELDDLWYVGNEYIKGNTEKLVRKNDIIMSSANSRELVGKVSYVHDIPEQMTFGGFVLNIRANEGILPFFLFLMLRALYLKGYYLTIATQTTNIANLNTKILGDIEILLPPLTEQERIINSVTNILASIENITAELS
jgi:type I restriction enzyme S subunit